MKVRGPLVTLGAVAVLGVGIWVVNVSQRDAPAPPAAEPAPTTPAAAPAPTTIAEPAPTTPAPPAFPGKADYVGEIPTGDGDAIVLDIAVDGAGSQAIAYGCDGNKVEAWFWGSADNGVVSMANKQNTSRLDGRLEGDRVVGTLAIGEKSYDFTTAAAPPPAGLFVYDDGGVRNSWIVDADGTVTGVQRRPDGSTAPAPGLSTDGTAVIDGRTVAATRIQGDSDF